MKFPRTGNGGRKDLLKLGAVLSGSSNGSLSSRERRRSRNTSSAKGGWAGAGEGQAAFFYEAAFWPLFAWLRQEAASKLRSIEEDLAHLVLQDGAYDPKEAREVRASLLQDADLYT